MTYNLLIVEDHALTRFGLKTTFENIEFIGTNPIFVIFLSLLIFRDYH